MGVFSHLLKIDDALIGVMSCMSKILAGFVYAYAETDFQIYLGKSTNKNCSIIKSQYVSVIIFNLLQ